MEAGSLRDTIDSCTTASWTGHKKGQHITHCAWTGPCDSVENTWLLLVCVTLQQINA